VGLLFVADGLIQSDDRLERHVQMMLSVYVTLGRFLLWRTRQAVRISQRVIGIRGMVELWPLPPGIMATVQAVYERCARARSFHLIGVMRCNHWRPP